MPTPFLTIHQVNKCELHCMLKNSWNLLFCSHGAFCHQVYLWLFLQILWPISEFLKFCCKTESEFPISKQIKHPYNVENGNLFLLPSSVVSDLSSSCFFSDPITCLIHVYFLSLLITKWKFFTLHWARLTQILCKKG